MKTVKKVLNHFFIEGLSGMAMGLFATLIVGTIIQQVGNLIGGPIGEMIFFLGKMAAAMTSAGIGVGVAHRFKESPLVTVSAATAGMVGGFASKILAGTVLVDGTIVLAGPGEPLGAFLARRHLKSLRSGGGSGHCRLLLQYGRLRCGQLPGK